MTVLFIFLDGVGLGLDDSEINPFARAVLPNLNKILNGSRFVNATAPFFRSQTSLLALDANLGIMGLPQSATGQAVLLTGLNVPARIGYHYGPKPNKETAAYLLEGGIFGALTRKGKKAALLNAYPPGYFEGINSGKRLLSAIPLAVRSAGIDLFTQVDLMAGDAMSADFTALGWRDRMNMMDIPVLSLKEAGIRMGELARKYDFAFFEYWLTDYAGHGQNMDTAINLLEEFDIVLGALIDNWDSKDLILITSDHGNIEDLSTRRHTANPVPLLLFGSNEAQNHFVTVKDLVGVAQAIMNAVGE